ncbi:MAG: mechanosensitive ion channel family protein [Candidatus Omnitrophota bacterium]
MKGLEAIYRLEALWLGEFSMDAFERVMSVTLFDNTLRAYTASILVMAVLMTVLGIAKNIVVRHFGRLAAKTANDFDDFLVELVKQNGWSVFAAVALYIAVQPLHLAPVIRSAVRILFVLTLTWRVVSMGQEVIKYAMKKKWRRSITADPTSEVVARNLTNVFSWILWVLAVIFLLDNLGVNISALVAGLGIGGVAVAMASQAILGDLFSSISIFIDKPFMVGDFIVLDDYMGEVEHIGLKTTRIRSVGGEQLILSNSDLTKSRIRNFKRMHSRRIAFKFSIVYQTPSQKARRVSVIVREICDRIEGIKLDRVHFQALGEFALVYEVVYFVASADYNVYMDRQQEMNFRLKEAFESEGIEFAYPTQSIRLRP